MEPYLKIIYTRLKNYGNSLFHIIKVEMCCSGYCGSTHEELSESADPWWVRFITPVARVRSPQPLHKISLRPTSLCSKEPSLKGTM